MTLFKTFMLFFGVSTVVGVPLVSAIQVTQIKGSTLQNWVEGLPTSLGPAAGVFVVICIIVYQMMKPLISYLKEADTRELSEEEKFKCQRILKNVNIISVISILAGYPIGNGITIILVTLAGKVNYNSTDIAIIFVLIILYALIAIQYSVNCFNAVARQALVKLNIHSTKGMKTTRFTASLGMTILNIACFVGWHLFCSGYSAVRHNWTIEVFIKKASFTLIESISVSVPLCTLLLTQLKKRFYITIKQIETLRLEGDLSTRLSIGTFDDFGIVMTEMNNLMDFLQNSLTKLKDENQTVGINAQDLLAVSTNSAQGMQQLVSSIKNVNTRNIEKDKLLDATKNNIDKLSLDAEKINSSMQKQSEAESENAAAITEMVQNINSINELISKAKMLSKSLSESSLSGTIEVEKNESIIATINEKSKKMNDVIKVIQKVAEQTNLLAMNAAIEAAHAGTSGKGFSVVAEEIRKLAENTQAQTKNISDLINEIIESIKTGSENMKSTKNMFGKIRNEIATQTDVVETISNSMNEQSIGAKDILSKTNKISVQINDVNSLIKNQTDYTQKIKNGIDNVVSISETVNNSINESEKIISDFSKTIETVKEKAILNQTSVQNATKELDKFNM